MLIGVCKSPSPLMFGTGRSGGDKACPEDGDEARTTGLEEGFLRGRLGRTEVGKKLKFIFTAVSEKLSAAVVIVLININSNHSIKVAVT